MAVEQGQFALREQDATRQCPFDCSALHSHRAIAAHVQQRLGSHLQGPRMWAAGSARRQRYVAQFDLSAVDDEVSVQPEVPDVQQRCARPHVDTGGLQARAGVANQPHLAGERGAVEDDCGAGAGVERMQSARQFDADGLPGEIVLRSPQSVSYGGVVCAEDAEGWRR
eukprot:5682516-Prymnesium_polylepis.2